MSHLMTSMTDNDGAAKPGLTDDEEEMVTNYKKMLKMGMPEGAVVQKMAVDEVPKHVQDVVLAPADTEETPKDTSGGLTDDEEAMVTKYKKMLKMGMPEGAVDQKMDVDDVPKHVQDIVLAPADTEETPKDQHEIATSSVAAAASGGLTDDEEEMVAKYKKMLKMGMPEGAVVQKMEVDEVPKHIQDVVLAPSDSEEAPKEQEEVVASTFVESNENANDQDGGGNQMEEEVIEEEYYDEEEEYDEEEIIEEIVDDDSDGGGDNGSQGSSSVEPPPSESDTAPSEAGSSVQPDPEGITNFAEFPPLSEDEAASRPTDQSMDFADFTTTSGSPEDESTSTSQPAASIERRTGHAADVENQQQSAQFTPAITPESQAAYNRDEVEAEKEPIKPSAFWYWLVFFLVCALLGAGAYVGWYLVNEDRKNAPDLGEDDSLTRAPTPAPTVGETTPFDPIQGDCDFRGLQNPHVIDQCNCVGEIQIIADDVRARYFSRLETFIPTIYENFDEEIDSCSPRNQALVWISSGNEYDFTYEEKVDRFALATLYAGLNGVNWDRNNNWLSDQSVCEWEGISCDDGGMAQLLALSENGLDGTLPPEVGLLSNMLEFKAARNVMEGPIPEALFFVEGIEIVDLGFNGFTGPLPPAVGNAKELIELNLEENVLSGRISQDLAGAEKLQVLDLSANDLVGSLPTTIFDLQSLETLDLGGNMLTGTIPNNFVNFENMTSLTLGPNSFRGEIPSTIADLTNLEFLVIREIPDLAGRLPASFGRNLKQLLELTITTTNIAGNIETDLGALSNLIRLDLSANQLRGTIPSELGNLGNLTVLSLGSNFLDGSIPATLGNLANLTRLSLNDNVLRGGVPNELGLLDDLQFLQLDGLLLTGRVSQEVCDLRDQDLSNFIVDCPFVGSDGVQVGVICDIPSCCTGCRTEF